MLRSYSYGKHIPYLEALYFQFGRYLLISSSRKGTLPANLQGVWNVHDHSPWGSGYWHNINVQMNYWPAFSTNLSETFDAYADFNVAFRPKAELLAREYIQQTVPENNEAGKCGWTVGTGVYPYSIEGPGGHSGPGTGGLTTKLFWDAYDFTRDPEILKTVTYPALRGMSEFLTKTIRLDVDGLYRADFSASPEQGQNKQYYYTRGCAFDQQMIWENGHVKDLVARGAFEVDIRWKEGLATEIRIHSKVGGNCNVSYPSIEHGCFLGADQVERQKDLVTFDTVAGCDYLITQIPANLITNVPHRLALRKGELKWKAKADTIYRIYQSVDDAPDYLLLAELTCGNFRDPMYISDKRSVLYKVTAQKKGHRESIGAVIAATNTDRGQLQRYRAYVAWTKAKDLGWYFCCEMDRIAKAGYQVLQAKWSSINCESIDR